MDLERRHRNRTSNYEGIDKLAFVACQRNCSTSHEEGPRQHLVNSTIEVVQTTFVKSAQPLISIVIPTYNRAKVISEALKSVQQQTYKNWEAIVVDDGSKDNTWQVVDDLARDDRRIRFIRQEKNRGAQVARNAGIRAARGEWVAFLDSDDLLLPNSLEIRLEAVLKANISVVHSECNWIEKDGVIRAYGIPPIAGWVHQRLLAGPAPVFHTLLVAKDALERIGYLDEKIVAFQEWETVIRLAKHYRFGFVASPTCIYDCRHSDSMSRNDLLGAKGYEQVFQKHFMAILLVLGLMVWRSTIRLPQPGIKEVATEPLYGGAS